MTVTLGRPSLRECCASVDAQTFDDWHHFVLGDGVLPEEYPHSRRSSLGFSTALGGTEPAQNMPGGTPNPLLRWAIRHLDLSSYLCFLDDDNLYAPNFIAKMVAALDMNPKAGIALCAVENHRATWQAIDGYPEYRRCDNSAFLVRSTYAKAVGFPPGRPDRECVQDYEFIRAVAERFGWVRVSEPLTIFGASDNTPPARGGIRVVYSWALPVRGAELARSGRFEEGRRVLEEAVRFDPLDAWAWWHLGETSLISGYKAHAREAWAMYRSLLDRLPMFPDDWSEYCYALGALLGGDRLIAERHMERAAETAHRNNFAEQILRAENELNLGIYWVPRGSEDNVIRHVSRALQEGLGEFLVGAAVWKARVLSETLGCVPADQGQRLALEALRREIGRCRGGSLLGGPAAEVGT